MTDISRESWVEDGYGAVADVFHNNFACGLEQGASVVAFVDERPVVRLWGGFADQEGSRPFHPDTPTQVFSCTKAITAIAVHMAVEEGLISYETPLVELWPEFGAAGKETITLADTLSHRSGVAALDVEVDLEGIRTWHPVVEAVARQAPKWMPGARHGYHLRTFGWIHGEVLRRLYGKRPSQVVREKVADPLGAEFRLDWDCDLNTRLADLLTRPSYVDTAREVAQAKGVQSPLAVQAIFGPSNLFAYDQRWNTSAYRQLAMPSSSGMTSAESLATIFHATVTSHEGTRLLCADTIRRATEERSRGVDEVLGYETAFGLGFALAPMIGETLPASAFGHGGAGGSLGIADLDAKMGFGYVMNRMARSDEQDDRSHRLAAALYECME